MIDLRKMDSIYKLDHKTITHYFEAPLSVSSDNKYFTTGSTNGEIYIFNLEDGKLVETLNNKSKGITSVQWRPYHSQLYVSDISGQITTWGV